MFHAQALIVKADSKDAGNYSISYGVKTCRVLSQVITGIECVVCGLCNTCVCIVWLKVYATTM